MIAGTDMQGKLTKSLPSHSRVDNPLSGQEDEEKIRKRLPFFSFGMPHPLSLFSLYSPLLPLPSFLLKSGLLPKVRKTDKRRAAEKRDRGISKKKGNRKGGEISTEARGNKSKNTEGGRNEREEKEGQRD